MNCSENILSLLEMEDENKSIMETILVEIRNTKAYNLLKNLESLHVIKILGKEKRHGQKLSEKYGGKLPGDIADKLQSYVAESRSEWNNRNF